MKTLYTFISCICLMMIAPVTTNAQYTKLFDFDYVANGASPQGDLISDGTYLYGMTRNGGATENGIIFKIKPDGTGFTNLMDFSGAANGSAPNGSLISDGTYLYGMAYSGGLHGIGVIFKIKPDGTGYTDLHDFSNAEGVLPLASLTYDGTFLYGMTEQGGANAYGIIFKIMPDGTGFTKLMDFSGTADGRNPYGSLFTDGTFLYGMTSAGGINDMGVLFKIKTDGTGFVKLLDFAGTSNGNQPFGTFISDGTYLYGMTEFGGTLGNGVIFKIKPDGTGYLKILNFIRASKGGFPLGSLVTDGNFLYGMTWLGGANDSGVVFMIKPDGTGYSKLLDFAGPNGAGPAGSLIIDGNILYGMTAGGGASYNGIIFKFDLLGDGITKNNTPSVINVSPNPFNNILSLNNTKEKGEAVLYDVMGKEMLRQKTTEGETRLNTSQLAAGFYMLSYTEGDASTSLSTRNVKVVKN